MTPKKLSQFSWFALAMTILVILWGAFVRATGSGAGCGSHWPLCNGEIIPRAETIETLIEFSHRLSSGVAFLMVFAVWILAFKVFPKGHRARWAASLSMFLMVLEAAIGAGLVLFELVADNASMARALFVAVHLGNTFLLLGAMTLTAYWSGGGLPISLGPSKPLRLLMSIALFGTLLIGMSGAVAALGDTLFPSGSLQEAFEQDMSATSHVLIQLRKYHPLIAIAVSFALFALISRVRNQRLSPEARKWATRLNLLILSQLTAGTLNIVLLAPVWMQMVHLLLADALWIALVLTCTAVLAEEEGSECTSVSTEPTNDGVPSPIPS